MIRFKPPVILAIAVIAGLYSGIAAQEAPENDDSELREEVIELLDDAVSSKNVLALVRDPTLWLVEMVVFSRRPQSTPEVFDLEYAPNSLAQTIRLALPEQRELLQQVSSIEMPLLSEVDLRNLHDLHKDDEIADFFDQLLRRRTKLRADASFVKVPAPAKRLCWSRLQLTLCDQDLDPWSIEGPTLTTKLPDLQHTITAEPQKKEIPLPSPKHNVAPSSSKTPPSPHQALSTWQGKWLGKTLQVGQDLVHMASFVPNAVADTPISLTEEGPVPKDVAIGSDSLFVPTTTADAGSSEAEDIQQATASNEVLNASKGVQETALSSELDVPQIPDPYPYYRWADKQGEEFIQIIQVLEDHRLYNTLLTAQWTQHLAPNTDSPWVWLEPSILPETATQIRQTPRFTLGRIKVYRNRFMHVALDWLYRTYLPASIASSKDKHLDEGLAYPLSTLDDLPLFDQWPHRHDKEAFAVLRAELNPEPEINTTEQAITGQVGVPSQPEQPELSAPEVWDAGWHRFWSFLTPIKAMDLAEAEVLPPPQRALSASYAIRESRKIEPNTWNYYDHPNFGVIVRVSKAPLEVQEEELLAEDQGL